MVRKRKSSEAVETSRILGSFVNYAHEGEGEAIDEIGGFGDFDANIGEIDPGSAPPPYTKEVESGIAKMEKIELMQLL